MKSFVSTILAMAVFTLVMTGCGKDDGPTGPGGLEATAKIESSNGDAANNARMNLAMSQNDLNKGSYFIEDAIANKEGLIIISDLEPGKYYFDCISGNYGQEAYYTEGTFTIEAGEVLKKTIVLEPM